MKGMNLSTSAERGLCRGALGLLLLAAVFPAYAQRTFPLVRDGGHLYAETLLQDSIPVRVMLESGIPFTLIDSALVWSHPDCFEPRKLDRPVRFRMAAGADYTASYKLAPGLSVGGSRCLNDVFVVDLDRHKGDLLYPLNTFTTDSAALPGMFGLDIRRGELRMLAETELPESGGAWTAYDMTRDERMGMYRVAGPLTLVDDRGGRTSRPMELVVDLGNATLLALFAYKPEVKEFVSESRIRVQDATTSGGQSLRVLMPSATLFLDAYSFAGQPVLLLEKPMRLPGDGFLGLPFFERFSLIFDFRHARLWVADKAAE